MFIEVRRKDWAESFAHHCVTLALLYYSWQVNFTRPGMMVMLLHDVSDIFLEAAKVGAPLEGLGVGRCARLKQGGRVAAAGVWVLTRLLLAPSGILARAPSTR
jgi:hypothetical protein